MCRQGSIESDICAIADTVVALRRDFHAYPELGFEETRTSEIVAQFLDDLGIKVIRDVGGTTGVVGLLEGVESDKTVALRADMDALPVEEANDLEYRSKVKGVMHACGHDAHTAVLLGAAAVLSKHRDSLKGNVKFIFQPAEEGKGGAKYMVEAGVLDAPEVDAIFALHVWPELPEGIVGYRYGTTMASSDHFHLTVEGKGAHGASPHSSNDVIVAASLIVQALQTVISRGINPVEPGVLSIGSFHAGINYNVIPEKAELLGTIRASSPDARETIHNLMEERIKGIAAAMGVQYRLVFGTGYPPTVNDEFMTNLLKATARDVVGADRLKEMPAPSMCGEDFSFYLQKVPGCYFYLGVGSKDPLQRFPGLHNPSFSFNDRKNLSIGVELFVKLAFNYLNSSNFKKRSQ